MSLYIDGVLAASETNVTYAAQDFNPLWVGAGANEALSGLGDFYWVGGVDEVAIYDRALTLGEVQDHIVASFGVGTAPVITFDPQYTLVVYGDLASISVGARGLPLLTYQWQRDGVDVPGANAATLDIAEVSGTDAGFYRCIVSNPYGAVTSEVGQLDVLLVDNGISFNLKEPWEDQLLAATDIAGFYPFPNWNNVAGTDTQPLAGVVDKNGDAVPGLDVRWSLSNTWGDGSAGVATPDARLARGYFDDGDNPGEAAGDGGVNGDGIGVSVTVSNVPYSEYNVVLYRTSDQGAAGSFVTFTVNGVDQTSGATTPFGDVGGWVLNENMLIYEGLSGSTLTIRVQSRDGSARGSLSGFQIISPVPPMGISAFGIDPDGSTYSLSWDSAPGTVYAVESGSDMVTGPWTVEPGAGAITATGDSTSWTGTVAGAANNYRVVESP
jgi:hypothetical protein